MLAILWGKPLYATHHLKSHIYANWLTSEEGLTICPQSEVGATPEFPLVSDGDFWGQYADYLYAGA